MDRAQILAGIKRVLSGEESFYSFHTDCPLEKRMDFIFSILFHARSRPAFYLRYIICRLAMFVDYSPAKVLLYRMAGTNIGEGVYISPDVFIDPNFPQLIELEDYCVLGWGAVIACHQYSGHTYSLGRVKIGRGSVIGHHATIAPGTTIKPMVCIPRHGIITRKTEPGALHCFGDKYISSP